jgi:hypothetical protein
MVPTAPLPTPVYIPPLALLLLFYLHYAFHATLTLTLGRIYDDDLRGSNKAAPSKPWNALPCLIQPAEIVERYAEN